MFTQHKRPVPFWKAQLEHICASRCRRTEQIPAVKSAPGGHYHGAAIHAMAASLATGILAASFTSVLRVDVVAASGPHAHAADSTFA